MNPLEMLLAQMSPAVAARMPRAPDPNSPEFQARLAQERAISADRLQQLLQERDQFVNAPIPTQMDVARMSAVSPDFLSRFGPSSPLGQMGGSTAPTAPGVLSGDEQGQLDSLLSMLNGISRSTDKEFTVGQTSRDRFIPMDTSEMTRRDLLRNMAEASNLNQRATNPVELPALSGRPTGEGPALDAHNQLLADSRSNNLERKRARDDVLDERRARVANNAMARANAKLPPQEQRMRMIERLNKMQPGHGGMGNLAANAELFGPNAAVNMRGQDLDAQNELQRIALLAEQLQGGQNELQMQDVVGILGSPAFQREYGHLPFQQQRQIAQQMAGASAAPPTTQGAGVHPLDDGLRRFWHSQNWGNSGDFTDAAEAAGFDKWAARDLAESMGMPKLRPNMLELIWDAVTKSQSFRGQEIPNKVMELVR